MANTTPTPPQQPSTATKVVIGTGVAALLGGILGAFSSKKKPSKPMSGCGACGR